MNKLITVAILKGLTTTSNCCDFLYTDIWTAVTGGALKAVYEIVGHGSTLSQYKAWNRYLKYNNLSALDAIKSMGVDVIEHPKNDCAACHSTFRSMGVYRKGAIFCATHHSKGIVKTHNLQNYIYFKIC